MKSIEQLISDRVVRFVLYRIGISVDIHIDARCSIDRQVCSRLCEPIEQVYRPHRRIVYHVIYDNHKR